VKHITRTEAVKIVGRKLPYFMNWYLLTGLQYYPTYGDYAMTWAGENGLTAIIGKQKAQAKAVAA